MIPGGTDRKPPRPRGSGEDVKEGMCGEGGIGGQWVINSGNNGAVR